MSRRVCIALGAVVLIVVALAISSTIRKAAPPAPLPTTIAELLRNKKLYFNKRVTVPGSIRFLSSTTGGGQTFEIGQLEWEEGEREFRHYILFDSENRLIAVIQDASQPNLISTQTKAQPITLTGTFVRDHPAFARSCLVLP